VSVRHGDEEGNIFTVEIEHRDAQRYESLSRQVHWNEIDEFVRESVQALRQAHAEKGRPFSIYMGCDKDDEQLVEVCLPTAEGRKELPGGEVAFTTARGSQCEYPQILSAYDAVTSHIGNVGRSFAGPPREIYLTELDAEDGPEMQIAFPLQDTAASD
jgi:hypothetical protein